MQQWQNLRFKTFVLGRNRHSLNISYAGRRKILIPDYKKSAYIRCLLEFECEYIPVIDPTFWFHGKETHITSSACILIVEHSYEYQKLRTGIVIPDVREVINLPADNFKPGTKQLSFNMQFVLKLPKKTSLNGLLNYSHLELLWRERQKQADEDFAAFEKKCRAKVTC